MKKPIFCPNKGCIFHHRNRIHRSKKEIKLWYACFGRYTTKIGGVIQRFRCCSCKITFSTQTFSLTHRFRKPGSFSYIFEQLRSSAGIRSISRDIKSSPRTVQIRISRMARQAIAVHADLTADVNVRETLTADGFESFTVSQFFPNNINLLAGKDSQFLYAFDYSHLRRKGKMTDHQKTENQRLKAKFHSGKSVRNSFITISRTIDDLMAQSDAEEFTINTDRKREYQQVFKAFPFCKTLIHKTFSSKKYRNYTNPLFAVNYLDREIRKDCAEHTRETLQHARNVNNSMERLAIYSMYHNYIKPFRINKKENIAKDATHGEIAGINREKIEEEIKTIFTKRRFLFRTRKLKEQDVMLWIRALATPLKQGIEPPASYAA